MAAFVVGDRYLAWQALGESDRPAAILADLASYFGPKALSPAAYDEIDWPSNPWTGGGYAAFMPPGVLTTPVGRIHWAGTEMANRWPGFFDGAVRTGAAAAATIHTCLAEANS